MITEIYSDFNIFLCHESEDIDNKSFISKI